MGTLKRFINEEQPEELHPTARAWIARVRDGQRATVTLWRKRDGLVHKPAQLYVTFETPGGSEREHDDWDPDLDESLLREGLRAESAENEARRLALMLRAWFASAESRYGPGYFESVLVDVLRGSEFAEDPDFVAFLGQIHVNKPDRGGRSYPDCVAAIEATLAKAGYLLTKALKYSDDEARSILAGAVAQYLDERFHITSRKLLGWR
jgi:hypothetical protein